MSDIPFNKELFLSLCKEYGFEFSETATCPIIVCDSIVDIIKRRIEDSFYDMSAHSYNRYTDNSDRYIYMTVGEMKKLYEVLGGDTNNLPVY